MQTLFEYSDILNSPCEAFLVTQDTCDFPVLPHWHFFMECILMLEGSVEVDCDGKKYTLIPNDMILFHPKAVHSFYKNGSEDIRYIVLKFDIHRLGVPKLQAALQHANGSPLAPIHFHQDDLPEYHFSDAFHICMQEMFYKNLYFNQEYQATICTLLIQVLRHWTKNGYNIKESMLQHCDMDSIDRITEYIDHHSSEPLKVVELAERCHMSYSHFAKSFHEVYGQSCKEYIALIRVAKAEEYLLFTDCDLSFISQETGFSDCSHLIKTFRKYKNVTPKQYRLGR